MKLFELIERNCSGTFDEKAMPIWERYTEAKLYLTLGIKQNVN